MTRRRSPRRTAALALAALTLVAGTACGDDDVETSTGDEVPTETDGTTEAPLGAGGGAASTCLEGTPDCEDTPMDPDAPVSSPDGGSIAPPGSSDEAFPTEAARDQARSLLGVAEAELTPDVRVGRRGQETFALTEDYVLGRITVELDDDGSGTYAVTSATVELPDGPETFDA